MAGGFAPNNLVQDINPMTWWGNQMGFININTQADGGAFCVELKDPADRLIRTNVTNLP
ncbi:MAG TPA: hypothetical protein VG269_10355 [Tepidisphaeraceae bacterium]|jgi:hypothetical protein|nr:hypothetical protein [Tepidisphaeraceae bacterium]